MPTNLKGNHALLQMLRAERGRETGIASGPCVVLTVTAAYM